MWGEWSASGLLNIQNTVEFFTIANRDRHFGFGVWQIWVERKENHFIHIVGEERNATTIDGTPT